MIYRYNKCTNTQLPTFNAGAASPGTTRTSSRSCRMATCSSLTPSRSSCSTPTATSSRPTPALLMPELCPTDAQTGSSTSPSTRAALRSGPTTRSPGPSGSRHRHRSGHADHPTNSPYLSGLSVVGELEAATARHVGPAPDVPDDQPVTGNFSTPTPVSAVLTNPTRDAHRQRAGHLHPQRVRDVHGDHRRHRHRHLRHHGHGALEQLHVDGFVPG